MLLSDLKKEIDNFSIWITVGSHSSNSLFARMEISISVHLKEVVLWKPPKLPSASDALISCAVAGLNYNSDVPHLSALGEHR